MEVKKTVLYDPAISSLNLGDHIISMACRDNLKSIIPSDDMIINISTHFPVSNIYMSLINDIRFSFVLGSNLLMPKMDARFRQWDIKIWNAKSIKPIILMGVGWNQYSNKTTIYTKKLYKDILSKDYIHSVRDEYTKEKLKEIGINNVINTGCPSLWNLTKEHCKKIPTNKAKKVIFTLTDYNKDFENDLKLINVLCKNYKEVYFWVQGGGDFEYINEFCNKNIKIVKPSIEAYDEILIDNDIDYVGTRLHGGIRALQNKKRTIIIAIDNRARELNKDYNLPIVNRNDISKLEELINKEFVTNINIPEENINKWKEQFKK